MKNESKLNFDYITIDDKYFGGNQEWYSALIYRLAGCGATAASNMVMYELRKNGEQINTQKDLLNVMNKSIKCVIPGIGGVSRIELFEQGYDKLKKKYNMENFKSHILEVPKNLSDRPSNKVAYGYLNEAMKNGHAVAFLNLDNGEEKRVESWHWVVIVGISYDEENDVLEADLSDQGKHTVIDLGLWIKTTKKNGGFIYYA